MEATNEKIVEIFALANRLRVSLIGHAPKRRRKLKASWGELREYLEEYRDVFGQ